MSQAKPDAHTAAKTQHPTAVAGTRRARTKPVAIPATAKGATHHPLQAMPLTVVAATARPAHTKPPSLPLRAATATITSTDTTTAATHCTADEALSPNDTYTAHVSAAVAGTDTATGPVFLGSIVSARLDVVTTEATTRTRTRAIATTGTSVFAEPVPKLTDQSRGDPNLASCSRRMGYAVRAPRRAATAAERSDRTADAAKPSSRPAAMPVVVGARPVGTSMTDGAPRTRSPATAPIAGARLYLVASHDETTTMASAMKAAHAEFRNRSDQLFPET
ncbi:hypothetical protein RhoFasK5_03450|nr:hypothetical protein [Rhodococcus kroppenstedtii]